MPGLGDLPSRAFLSSSSSFLFVPRGFLLGDRSLPPALLPGPQPVPAAGGEACPLAGGAVWPPLPPTLGRAGERGHRLLCKTRGSWPQGMSRLVSGLSTSGAPWNRAGPGGHELLEDSSDGDPSPAGSPCDASHGESWPHGSKKSGVLLSGCATAASSVDLAGWVSGVPGGAMDFSSKEEVTVTDTDCSASQGLSGDASKLRDVAPGSLR